MPPQLLLKDEEMTEGTVPQHTRANLMQQQTGYSLS